MTPKTEASFKADFVNRGPGRCFLVHPDREAGTKVSVSVTFRGQRVDLEGVVERTDFDENGNEGLLVKLDAASTHELNIFVHSLEGGRVLGDTQLKSRQVGDATEDFPAADLPVEREFDPDAHRDALLAPGAMVDGRFKIERHLATGGMGEVYRANHVHLKRAVALKLMRRALAADPEMWSRFQREAELVSQLESPHVVRTFDFGRTEDGSPYLAMEFVEGRTLDKELEEGPLTPPRAIDVLTQVCEGLSEAHALGVIHRDLKPPNIIIGRRRDGTEVVKILDFGIARLADGENKGDNKRLTQMGFVVGTPSYLAPEQALAGEVDQRTDVYALGCVAYELLTGRPPFVADDLPRIISMHLTASPEPLPSLRPDLAQLPGLCAAVLKALSKERERRFPTVKAFAAALASDSVGWGGDVPTSPVHQRINATPMPTLTPQPVVPPRPPAPKTPRFTLTPQPVQSLEPRAPLGATGVLPSAAPAPLGATGVLPSQPRRPVITSQDSRPPPPRPAESTPAEPMLEAEVVDAAPVPGRAPTAAVIASLVDDRTASALQRGRDAVDESVRRGVFAYFEVMGVPVGSPASRACLTRALEVLAAYGGFLDRFDEDGALAAFTSEHWLPAGRAVTAVLAVRDAVADEAARLNVGAKLRAGLLSAELRHGGASLAGDALEKAHALAARFQAGQVVCQRALVSDLGQLVDTASTWSADVLQLTARKVVAAPPVELVGRTEVLDAMERRLQKVAQGTGLPVVLQGPSRSGRTAMALDLVGRAKKHNVVALPLMAFPSWKTQPNAVVTAFVCAVCEVPMDVRASRLRAALDALKLPAPMVEAALTATGVTQSPWGFTTGQSVHVLRAVLRARVPTQPLLLLVDGVEHLDEQSLAVLAELLLRPVGAELTVVLGAPQGEHFEGVAKAALEPLEEHQLAKLVQTALGGQPGPKLLAALQERSSGLPGVIHDWLSILNARGSLVVKSSVVELIDEVPSLEPADLPRARLELLPPDAARVLEAAWCQGETFDTATIAKTWPRLTQDAMQKASAHRLVMPSFARRWALSSPGLLDAVASMRSAERPALHQRLAAALIEQAKAGGAVDPLLIGRQFLALGDGPRAAAIFQQAVDAALTRRAPRDAAAAWKGLADALALGGPAQALKRADCLSRAASCALVLLDVVLARAALDEALAAAAPTQKETPELLLAMTRVLRVETRRSRSAEALDKAELAGGGTPLETLIFVERGEAAEQDGDLDAALASFTSAMGAAEAGKEVARWHGEVDLPARLEARLGALALQKKDVATARHLFDSSSHRWRLARSWAGEARAQLNLATACALDRDLGNAARWFGAAAEAASRSGDLLLAARAFIQQAKTHKKNGANADARQAATEARRLAMLVGWDQGRTEATGLMS